MYVEFFNLAMRGGKERSKSIIFNICFIQSPILSKKRDKQCCCKPSRTASLKIWMCRRAVDIKCWQFLHMESGTISNINHRLVRLPILYIDEPSRLSTFLDAN